jgi:hypothetical protein
MQIVVALKNRSSKCTSTRWPARMSFLLASLLLALCFPHRAGAQKLVPPDQFDRANLLFGEESKPSDLKCQIHYWGPVAGFDLTYSAGFVVLIDSAQPTPNDSLNAFVRVTPVGRQPVLLLTSFRVPANLPRLSANERFSFFVAGEFSIGEGKYDVELLVIGQYGRRSRSRWQLKVGRRITGSSLGPLMVSATRFADWNGEFDNTGPHLTVLMDATETSPGSVRLGPGTSAYLIDTLVSILRQVRCRSATVVAFNLDEQKGIFRAKRIDPAGLKTLAAALNEFNSASIAMSSLKSSAWRDFLAGLVHGALDEEEAPDAIVFVGAPSHFTDSHVVPVDLATLGKTRFFDFEYFRITPVLAIGPITYRGDYRNIPADDGAAYSPYALEPFPDAIDHLTHDLHGTVFHIRSPKDLATALQKVASTVGPTQSHSSN